MVAIPAATPIIKPHETFPEKKPIPVAIMAKAANVFPALPVTILKALQIDFEKVLNENNNVTTLCSLNLCPYTAAHTGDYFNGWIGAGVVCEVHQLR